MHERTLNIIHLLLLSASCFSIELKSVPHFDSVHFSNPILSCNKCCLHHQFILKFSLLFFSSLLRISQNTGIRAVDLGMPMLSMHSIREMMGVADLSFGHKLFTTFFKEFRSIDSSLKNVDSNN